MLERPVGGRPAQRSGDGDRLSVLDFQHGGHVGNHDPQLFGNRVEVGPGTAVEVPRQHRDGHPSLLHLGAVTVPSICRVVTRLPCGSALPETIGFERASGGWSHSERATRDRVTEPGGTSWKNCAPRPMR